MILIPRAENSHAKIAATLKRDRKQPDAYTPARDYPGKSRTGISTGQIGCN